MGKISLWKEKQLWRSLVKHMDLPDTLLNDSVDYCNQNGKPILDLDINDPNRCYDEQSSQCYPRI